MVRATGGSLYNRALVHPNYTDFGPRLGFAYNVMSKTVIRGGYGISYDYFNRPGSAIEGINAPLALFGVFTQNMPQGGPVPASFLTTQNSFSSGIANAANFNPLVSNVDYIPANFPWSYVQNWFLSVQREITKDTLVEISYNGNHSLDLPILADYNQATPNAAGGTLTYQQRAPVPTFGPITWVDPAGNNHYNGLSARLEHRFSGGLYFLNSFTWGRAIGDSEQALEYYAGAVVSNPQNIHNLAAEAGPSSFDVQFNNVTSVVYQLPFGKGRKYASSMNPVVGRGAGRVGAEHHQHRAHRHADQRLLHARRQRTRRADFRTIIAASRSCGRMSRAAPPARARRRCSTPFSRDTRSRLRQ